MKQTYGASNSATKCQFSPSGKFKPVRTPGIVYHQSCGHNGLLSVIFSWTALWLGWNLLAPKSLQFDPPMAFVFWLFISNMIQILLMPLIMIGQNLQGRHAELRAENDYNVNLRAEQEIETILKHLNCMDALLAAIMAHLDIKLNPIHIDQEKNDE